MASLTSLMVTGSYADSWFVYYVTKVGGSGGWVVD
jgi:hypothetical protein